MFLLEIGMCSILSVSYLVILSDAHECAHDSLPIHSTIEVRYSANYVPISSVREGANHTIGKRQVEADKPFVITPFFDSTVDDLPAEHRDLLKSTIPKVVSFFRKALMVRSSSGHVLIERQCRLGFFYSSTPPNKKCVDTCSVPKCGPVTIPDEHLGACVTCSRNGSNCHQTIGNGSGVSTDYILYVAANQERCKKASMLAYASHCVLESIMDRPVVGYINICPTALSIGKLESTAKHEIFHALGFSRSSYPFWRDENGNPRTPRNSRGLPPISQGRFIWSNSTIRSVTVQRETISGLVANPINIIVTPAVVREARAFFNCPTLEGVELENQGRSSAAAVSVGSHWEKRILMPEGMTAQMSRLAPFTRLTFALLEDTGWYRPDYSLAEPMKYGQNLGCDFVEQSCLTWIKKKQAVRASTRPFCTTMKRPNVHITGCTFDRASTAQCTLTSFRSPLPMQFRYFQDTGAGSYAKLADYCPFYRGLSAKDSNGMKVPKTCADQQFQPGKFQNIFAETYGSNSRCLDHGSSTKWSVNKRTFTNYGGSGCYQTSCTKKGLVISIFGVEFTCACLGEEIVFDIVVPGRRYKGSIVCPACKDICWENPGQCPSTAPAPCFGSVRQLSRQTGRV